MKQKKPVIYFAASLFNGRETYFNSLLTEKLEDLGYKVILPQRDGFEFGRLTEALSEKLLPEEIGPAVQMIIYLLDMGIFVPKSNIVLAILEEPQDAGVDVEIAYAKMIGKFVIGLRTDVRSPYGSISEPLGGMHFFPVYQCDVFIRHYMPSKTVKEREEQLTDLLEKVNQAIKTAETKQESIEINSDINRAAKLLFEGIDDIHSEEGLEKIVLRYLEHKKELEKIGPKIL